MNARYIAEVYSTFEYIRRGGDVTKLKEVKKNAD